MRWRALIARDCFSCSFCGALIKVDYTWIWYTWFFSDLHMWKSLKPISWGQPGNLSKQSFAVYLQECTYIIEKNGDLFVIYNALFVIRTEYLVKAAWLSYEILLTISYFCVATLQKYFILRATNVQGWVCTFRLYSVWNTSQLLTDIILIPLCESPTTSQR